MKRNKLITFFAMSAMVILLAACGDADANKNTDNVGSVSVEESAKNEETKKNEETTTTESSSVEESTEASEEVEPSEEKNADEYIRVVDLAQYAGWDNDKYQNFVSYELDAVDRDGLTFTVDGETNYITDFAVGMKVPVRDQGVHFQYHGLDNPNGDDFYNELVKCIGRPNLILVESDGTIYTEWDFKANDTVVSVLRVYFSENLYIVSFGK